MVPKRTVGQLEETVPFRNIAITQVGTACAPKSPGSQAY